ncbi:MAG TPA: serine hydrolase domain-containing protein [Thermoanaerobaculia bacterium]|nr:serine hydrolase domain-containing protein [Thermoanaerobaculia bacterium]
MRRLTSLLLIPLAGCVSLPGEGAGAGDAPDLDRLFAAWAAPGAPGAAVLIRHNGRTVLTRGFGLADLEPPTPAGPRTAYRLASLTKQFTARVILILAEEGRLRLSDSISLHLPSLPPWGKSVTIRHLLTHTSGIADYEDLIPEGTTAQLHDSDVLDLVRTTPATSFEPGSSHRYSNSGYALLALIVERAAGWPFPLALEEKIFRPLGMSGTIAFVEGGPPVPRRAMGTSRRDGRWEPTDQSLTSAVLGDGGIYSSVSDLALWAAELDEPTLVRPERLAEAFSPIVPTAVAGVSYGYGWRVGHVEGRPAVFHSGETVGFRNAILRIPGERLTVAILTNRNEGEPMDLVREIARRMLDRAERRASAR